MSAVTRRAFEMVAHLRAAPPAGIALPFGIPDPEALRWRVSSDVWEELALAAHPLHPGYLVTPTTDAAARLLGMRLVTDEALPPNSMILEPVR